MRQKKMAACDDIQGKAKLVADTGTELAAYAALFISAFTSATLLPGSSEVALLTLLAMGRGELAMLGRLYRLRADRTLDLLLDNVPSPNGLVLNLAEGFGNEAANARVHFERARGSLYEVRAAVRVAIAWRYISSDIAKEALSGLDRLGGRLFGLARR